MPITYNPTRYELCCLAMLRANDNAQTDMRRSRFEAAWHLLTTQPSALAQKAVETREQRIARRLNWPR